MASFKEMTANEILNLGDEELGRMSQRELSHALRTISLVANKRITRLEKNVEKDKYKIAQDALNQVKKSGGRFSVGTKNRNQMQKEMARARQFMRMKTSKVTGAVETRRKREVQLYGKTHEQAIKEQKRKDKKKNKKTSKNDISRIKKEFSNKINNIAEAFEKFKEGYPNLTNQKDSNQIKRMLLEKIEGGLSIEETIKRTADELIKDYEQRQEEFNSEREDEFSF